MAGERRTPRRDPARDRRDHAAPRHQPRQFRGPGVDGRDQGPGRPILLPAAAGPAALMTYLLNAGTDYGAAGARPTDFPPPPFCTAEVARIRLRQQANGW